jgi:hypothetical protein
VVPSVTTPLPPMVAMAMGSRSLVGPVELRDTMPSSIRILPPAICNFSLGELVPMPTLQ